MKKTLITTVALAGLLLAACGDDEKKTSDTATADTTGAGFDLASVEVNDDAAACADGKTLEAGALTLATGDPAFPPYMIDDDPTSGEGFESALALAVAKSMGFESDAIT